MKESTMPTLHRTDIIALGRRRGTGRAFAPFRLLRLALVARVQRRSLATLDDAMLRDVGITRDQALSESKRRVWDVPDGWLR
jgi:uncharacterized protein YjiS (DUF1127 family)